MPRIFEATATVLQSGICIGIDIISCIHCNASTEVSFQEADANNYWELCCTNQHAKGSQLYSSHKLSARNAPTDVKPKLDDTREMMSLLGCGGAGYSCEVEGLVAT